MIRRLAIVMAAGLALGGCAIPAAVWIPAAAAGAGFGTAAITLDDHVFQSCIAGKTSFNCGPSTPPASPSTAAPAK